MSYLSFEEEQLLALTVDIKAPTKRATVDRLMSMQPEDEETNNLKSRLLSRLLVMNDKQFSVCCVYAMENKLEGGDLRECSFSG